MKDTNVLSNHQLNSAANYTDSADFPAQKREIPLLVSLWTRDAAAIPAVLPFFQSYPGRLILHLPAPRYESVTMSVQEAARKIGGIAASGRLIIWSGGWCGAALSLLTATEAEWELRWSLTNETDSGLEQLFGTSVQGFFPAAPTAAQAEHLARSRGVDVIGGYRRQASPGETTRELLVRERGQWRERTTRQISWQEVGETLPARRGTDEASAELAHLVVRQENVASGCPLLEVPEQSAQWLYRRISEISLPESPRDDRVTAPPPGVLYGVEANDLTAELFQKAPGAIRRRSETLHSSKGVAPILTALSLLENEPTGSTSRELRVPDFQGTTDGFFTVEAPRDLSALTVAGRPLQIRTAKGTGALRRRATGYVKRGAPVPEITYLTTRGASWYAGAHHRGVVEHAELGDAATLQLGTFTIDHKTALYFPWVLTMSPADGSSGATALRALSFDLDGVDAADPLELLTYDFEGTAAVTVVPAGTGATVVTAAALRVPVAGGDTLLIGGVDPGNRVILPWLIERRADGSGFSLSLIYAAENHRLSEGCLLSGTFLICAGDTPWEELQLDYVAAELVVPFSRTVPEKTGGRSASV